MSGGAAMIELDGVAKTFVMHVPGAAPPILENVAFSVRAGECAVLDGPRAPARPQSCA